MKLMSTNGIEFLVDDADLEKVSQGTWWVWIPKTKRNKTSYVQWNRRGGVIQLHRFLLDVPDNLGVDHKNGSGLDNRRENLRVATDGQNQANRPPTIRNKSGFKGVCWHRAAQRWVAQFRPEDGKSKSRHLGCFSTAEEAARAYDRAARQEHGDFAYLNFPGEV